jgi:SAM-dependent methyltransferase
VRYWERFGDRIGTPTPPPAAPPTAGHVDLRSVSIRAPIVLSVVPRDLNVVLQRVEPVTADEQFDLVLATNLLIYYDVFEQSLAMANVARMLRPGGVFLSNDRIFELPQSPLASVGHTSAIYLKAPGTADKGDRIDWYRRH